jgi:hypothetical protein
LATHYAGHAAIRTTQESYIGRGAVFDEVAMVVQALREKIAGMEVIE